MITIRVMNETDVPFCKELTDIEQWGYLAQDFKRLIGYEPNGCFVARKKNEKIGMITTTSYGNYAFLGSLIVRKDVRRKGIGLKLMKKGIDYLKKKGIKTIELDGVFPAVMLYRKLGFRDKYLSLRFMRRAEDKCDEKPSPHSFSKNVQKIPDFDREKTGLYRERITNRLLNDFARSVYVLGRKRIQAYAIVRPRAGGVFMVGPFIAENRKVAESLLLKIIKDYSTKCLLMGVPAVNGDAVNMMLRNGFMYKQPSLRMYCGERIDYERHIYGILSPEKG